MQSAGLPAIFSLTEKDLWHFFPSCFPCIEHHNTGISNSLFIFYCYQHGLQEYYTIGYGGVMGKIKHWGRDVMKFPRSATWMNVRRTGYGWCWTGMPSCGGTDITKLVCCLSTQMSHNSPDPERRIVSCRRRAASLWSPPGSRSNDPRVAPAITSTAYSLHK